MDYTKIFRRCKGQAPRLSDCNFHPLEVVCQRDTQLQVGGKLFTFVKLEAL